MLLGTAITLVLRGYQFGQSNHAVYLVDALRRIDPQLLAADWWTTSTLQYHFAFTHLSELLLRLDVIEPAFLIGYLVLAVLLHVGWLRLTLAVGGTVGAYLLSVALYYVSAAGLGLGAYHFLQDSAFLPSNVSNVAMLWGFYLWLTRRWSWAGVCLGIAGLFHLNYAIVGIGVWCALGAWQAIRTETGQGDKETRGQGDGLRGWLAGGAALVGLSMFSIAPAIGVILRRSEALPLAEFVALYVKLRHPHHYDPLSWEWGLWLSFLWIVPLGIFGWRRLPATGHVGAAPPTANAHRLAAAESGRIMLLLGGLLLVALLFAGVWFISEALVQMSLWRFSIYLKLLMSIGAAVVLARYSRLIAGLGAAAVVAALLVTLRDWGGFMALNRVPVSLFLLLCGSAVAVVLAQRRPLAALVAAPVLLVPLAWGQLGLRLSLPLEDDAEYMQLCDWVREHTPPQALLLVPPHEQSMRLHGRRAIVVNFKNVPQLSAELPQWRDRLRDVLDTDDLTAMSGPLHVTLEAMRQRYADLPAGHLLAVAGQYGATHIVTLAPAGPEMPLRPIYESESGRYVMYALDRPR